MKYGTVRDTAIGVWNKRWLNVAGHGAFLSRATHYDVVDSPFVCCCNELDYER